MSNCLIFALGRWYKRGGYLVIRKSRHGWWPHFIHCADLRNAKIESYVPENGILKVGPVQKFLFRGKIVVKD